jgi:DNA-binding NarL/FixJ family response regulator
MQQNEDQPAAMKRPISPLTVPDHARLRVLLVDDTPQVLQDLRLLLELHGEIEIAAEAANGQEAIRLVEELRPDVVVMDLEMPIMNGYEATRRIKSLLPATRVVILSVHAGFQEQEQARASGADDFIIKGAGYEALVNAILGKK